MNTLDKLNKCLLELGHPAVEDINSDFRETVGLDSLEWLEFIVLIEDVFAIEIPEDDYEKLKTVQEAVTYINSKAADGN